MRSFPLALAPTSGDMSQATVTIGPLDVTHTPQSAIQVVWSGSPTGSFQLQGTTGNPSASGSSQAQTWAGPWVSLGAAVAVPLTQNASGTSYAWDIVSTGMSAVQVVYTKTSGAGTITSATGQQKT